MNIDSYLEISRTQASEKQSQQIKKEKAANDFEEIFAKHLVKQMTKDTFKMDDNGGVMGNANSMYREHITDALAKELADQRKLGMADLVTRYWNKGDE